MQELTGKRRGKFRRSRSGKKAGSAEPAGGLPTPVTTTQGLDNHNNLLAQFALLFNIALIIGKLPTGFPLEKLGFSVVDSYWCPFLIGLQCPHKLLGLAEGVTPYMMILLLEQV